MEQRFGPHRVVVEDDIMISYADQPMTTPDIVQMLKLCDAIHAQFGRVYVVTVIGPRYDLPPECRKLIAEWGRDHTMTLSIIVGASFAMRTLLSMVARAQKLLGGKATEVEFAASEADARAMIARHKASSSKEQKAIRSH